MVLLGWIQRHEAQGWVLLLARWSFRRAVDWVRPGNVCVCVILLVGEHACNADDALELSL